MLLRIALGLFVAFAAFIVWRVSSVSRGARARDKRLLDRLTPLGERLDSGAAVAPDEMRSLAAAPELRPMLYRVLEHYERLDLFPEEFLSPQAQAESQLAYWMMHPNELQGAPAAMVLEQTLQREVGGTTGTFYVFRYTMPPGHWAGSDWILGLAGPFAPDDPPYGGRAAGFSRVNDVLGKVTPAELVDWYVGVVRDMLARSQRRGS